MKNFLIVIFCISATFTASARRVNPLFKMVGGWQIVSMANVKNALVPAKLSRNEVSIENNTIFLNVGCNNMSSKVESLGSSNIKFGEVSSTKMACTKKQALQEKQLKQLLRTIDNYKIIYTTEKQLILLSKGKKKIVLKELPQKGDPMPDKVVDNSTITQGIEGTYRIIQQLENGKMVERNTMASTLTFMPDNTYTATLGCNAINGSYALPKKEAIQFKAGLMTQMFCAGETGACESALNANLLNVNTFKKDGNHLYFYAGQDLVLMLENK